MIFFIWSGGLLTSNGFLSCPFFSLCIESVARRSWVRLFLAEISCIGLRFVGFAPVWQVLSFGAGSLMPCHSISFSVLS